MKILGELHKTGRLFLASLLIAASVIGAFPAPVKAASPPLDLNFFDTVNTSLSATNIRPGQSGTKVITLRNSGTQNGIVTIWASNITSSEGLNPESETGDKTGEGELDDHLRFKISVNGLSTNLKMPITINDFPQNYRAQKYIEIIPFKAGETKVISLYWELPAETGNEAQGDQLSFVLNYIIQPTEVTELTGTITPTGNITSDVTIYSENKTGKMLIKANTVAKTSDNKTPEEIWIVEIDNEPPPPPEGDVPAGNYYDAGPDGTEFDTPLTITLNYNERKIPAGINEEELYIALWNEDTETWDPIPGCIVDVVANTITAFITHFSRYSIFCPDVPPKPLEPAPETPGYPDYYIPPTLDSGEEEEEEEEESEELNQVRVNLGGGEDLIELDADGRLLEPITLKDPDSNFFLEIKAGSRITDADGNLLSRMEVETVERSVMLPDNTVILTPVYEFTGYDMDGNLTKILIDPPALLSIRYRSRDLPENSFLPFLVQYTEDGRMIILELPFGALVQLGWAQGSVTTGGLYFAAAEHGAVVLPELPAHFSASSLQISPSRVIEGEPVRISITVTNDGEETGSYELYLLIDGIVRAIREVTLTPKSTETSTFEISNLAAGTHRVEIAHLEGTVVVEKAATSFTVTEVNWPVIDFIVGGVVLLGLIIWFFFMRRVRHRQRESESYI